MLHYSQLMQVHELEYGGAMEAMESKKMKVRRSSEICRRRRRKEHDAVHCPSKYSPDVVVAAGRTEKMK